jgi:hypothetical protein
MYPGIQEEVYLTPYLLSGSNSPVDERIGEVY